MLPGGQKKAWRSHQCAKLNRLWAYFLDKCEWLAPSLLFFLNELGSTRTGNFMCRCAVPAGFRESPSMLGGFQFCFFLLLKKPLGGSTSTPPRRYGDLTLRRSQNQAAPQNWQGDSFSLSRISQVSTGAGALCIERLGISVPHRTRNTCVGGYTPSQLN